MRLGDYGEDQFARPPMHEFDVEFRMFLMYWGKKIGISEQDRETLVRSGCGRGRRGSGADCTSRTYGT